MCKYKTRLKAIGFRTRHRIVLTIQYSVYLCILCFVYPL